MLVILNKFFFYFPLSKISVFFTDYFTGSKSRININNNAAILMMPQPQTHNFGSRRPQILPFFCWNAAEWRLLMPPPPSILISSLNLDLEISGYAIRIHIEYSFEVNFSKLRSKWFLIKWWSRYKEQVSTLFFLVFVSTF